MKQYVICFLFSILISCGIKNKRQNKIKILELTSSGEVYAMKDKAIRNINNSFKIVFKKNLKIYVCLYIKLHLKNILDKNGQVINDKVVGADTLYRFFVTRKGEKYGLKYNLETFETEKGTYFSVDSLLSDLLIGPADLKHFDTDLGKPTYVQKKGKVIVEAFAVHQSNLDTIYRYYDSDLMDFDFSFSKRLDEQKKSKLFKTIFVFNSISKGSGISNPEIPRTEIFYEINKVKDKNVEKYEKIFNKYEKEVLDSKL
ncbi:hypothetical protein [Pedobacter boryungensis]|uniref:Lipoprotein n=1 Tax=Pedobacter boryungensis TaxID=869962 RepID=A0ABX2DH32_9SPHI|nr:hypothetical protein [Pedobacter boryungensis]NQX32434.1 hypothetical protein [Pedobacter boryungensis]